MCGSAQEHERKSHGGSTSLSLMICKRYFSHLGKWILAISLLLYLPSTLAETLRIPVQVEFPFLRQFILMQLFTGSGNTVDIAYDPSGCNTIILSDPQLSEQNHFLKMTTQVRARIGVALLGQCTQMIRWQGRAELLSQPEIKMPDQAIVSLDISDIQLFNQEHKRISTGILWDGIQSRLRPLMNQFTLDLRPTIRELHQLLPVVLPRYSATQVQKILNSFKIENLHTTTTGIDADVSFKVPALPKVSEPATALNEQEMRQWQRKWQNMDALLTYVIKHYASSTRLQPLRDNLFTTLIDARYQLQTALSEPVTHNNDPVRHWFIESWERLLPVIREIASTSPEQSPLAFISLATATETLHALDQMGPTVGLDISTAGLRRLVRILNKSPTLDPLYYDQAIDPELRKLFPFHSVDAQEPTGLKINFRPIKTAQAKTNDTRLNRWLPDSSELPNYLLEVRQLLINTAKSTSLSKPMPAATHQLYRHLVLATAWQESCWRQYVNKNNKKVPLRSGTGDTGIMQLNERVWRGFYNIHNLRWDIHYNASAGGEVLLNYLLKYALKKKEHQHPGGMDNLARATYSAYNGGPAQLSRYRKKSTPAALKKIDAAFFEKFKAVRQGNEMQIGRCLGLETADTEKLKRMDTTVAITPVTNAPSKAIKGETWIRSRNKSHYTLQLAAFSTADSAQNFIHHRQLSGPFAIYKLRKSGKQYFAVIYGDFNNKIKAKNIQRKLREFKPWLRQFNDIQALM